jgi:hypothetical protein
MKNIKSYKEFINENNSDRSNKDVNKTLTESTDITRSDYRTRTTDITQYYKDSSKEVKNAANELKQIVSGYNMRTSYDTELYDAIIKLVNAVKES